MQARFELPALSARDANATPPVEMFDFDRPALLEPPTLPAATEDPAWADICADTRSAEGDND